MITTDTLVIKKINMLSPDMQEEVFNFIDFMLSKQKKAKATGHKPVFGCAKGQFIMSDDFDAPLEDFKEYM
jgi:hypothetical protein